MLHLSKEGNNMDKLKVLAVDDPAVAVYTDKRYKIIDNFNIPTEITVLPWADYYNEMMESLEGKKDYDVVMVAGHLWMKDFIDKGYISEIHMDREDILKGILKDISYKGKYYLSPSFCDGHIIIYRKSIVKKYYGHIPEQVISPMEYCEMVRAVYDGTKSPSVAMKADESEIFTDALPYMRMFGGDAYNTSQGCVDDSVETINGLRAYIKLKKYAIKNTEYFGNNEVAQSVIKGNVPIATTWSGQMGVIYCDDCFEKEDLGFATFTKPWNVTWSFAINSRSHRKEEAELLLKYLRSPEVDLLAGRYSGCPIRLRNYEIDKERYPWYSCQRTMFELAEPLPLIENSGEKNQVFYKKIYQAFNGKLSAEEAMSQIKESIYRMNGGGVKDGTDKCSRN